MKIRVLPEGPYPVTDRINPYTHHLIPQLEVAPLEVAPLEVVPLPRGNPTPNILNTHLLIA
ncbi:MAG: hypothetical protein HY769_04525 [Candidatus Stahlbacteria bacterium]|nr:hypothetical protein [Candidatus Stahlbacteria bacterium]